MTTERKQWVSWEEFNALFPGLSPYSVIDFERVGGLTPGSIPFADAAGMLTEYNSAFFFDEANIRWGFGTDTPDVTIDVEFDSVATVISRVSAKTRPWRHWECVDGNWGLAIGIDADDGIIHFNYDTPIGTMDTIMMVFDGPNVRVGILDSTPAYPFDVGGNTRIQGTFLVTGIGQMAGLGIGKVPINVLDVEGLGQIAGGVPPGNIEVVARFHNTRATKNTAISIDALTDYDPILYLAENAIAIWGIRNDASETDKFQIRYQVGGANRIDFQIDNAGNIEIPSGTLTLASGTDINEFSTDIAMVGDSDNALPTEKAVVGYIQSFHEVSNEPTGFENRTASTLSWGGVRTLTIGPSNGSFDFYQEGTKYTKNAPENIQIADVSGVHYIYYDAGTLTISVNPSQATLDAIYETKPLVTLIYWNATDGTAYMLGDERHGLQMDGVTHRLIHNTRGATWREGLTLSGYTLDTGSDAALTFELTNGEFYDEDITHDITDGPAANQYEQQLSAGDAEIPILYRDDIDATWKEDAASTLPYKTGGTGRLAYNNDDGDGTFSQVEVTDNKFMSVTLVATHDWQYPIKMIQGQNEYTDKKTAAEEALSEILAFGTLPTPEMTFLYRLVMQTKDTFGGAKKAKIVDVTDLRGSLVTGATAVAVDHGVLSGLSDDDHSHYLLVDGTRAFTGAFTGITGSTIGNLTFTNGSITDSSGAISFGNENLSTTGTFSIGVVSTTKQFTIDTSNNDHNYPVLIKNDGNYNCIITMDSNRTNPGSSLGGFRGMWNGTQVAGLSFLAGDDAGNKDDGSLAFIVFEGGVQNIAFTIDQDGTPVFTGCVADGTCEIMKNEDALAIIDDILKTGSGKKDEYNHERMDMKKIHQKYPFMIQEQAAKDEDGKEETRYFDKLGAKSDLIYVAIGQLQEKIKALEVQLNN